MYIGVPLLLLLAAVVLGLWARLIVRKIINERWQETVWIQKFLVETLWHPFLHWFIFLGVYAAIQISILSPTVKRLVGQGVSSLFVLSLMWVVFRISERLITFYLGKVEPRKSVISLILTLGRSTIAVVGILTMLDIWGVPTQLISIFLVAGIFMVGLALRNNIDNLLAWFEFVYGEHVKVGHLIKLGSGEMGRVMHFSWTNTTIKTGEGNLLIIPNSKLMTNTIVNYGIGTESPASDIQRQPAIESAKPVDTLSDREREVLKLIGSGATNREIAQNLFISEHTVKSHLRSILNKLNLRNRQQAAVYAQREGLLGPVTTKSTSS